MNRFNVHCHKHAETNFSNEKSLFVLRLNQNRTKKKSNKFAKSSLNSVRLGINFKFRSKTQIRFYRRKKSLFLSVPTIIRRKWKKSNKFKTSKIWHLLNGITIQYCFIVNAYFFATKQNTTHRKSEKNPFLRALFHVFMTYFPECHANTKKPHWCVLTEKQSTLNIFYIYNNTRSFVCFNSLALSLSLSLTLSLSRTLSLHPLNVIVVVA